MRNKMKGMATPSPAQVEQLLSRVSQGDRSATDELLAMYRPRLKRMISVYLDRRILPRVDESDIVQETLLLAAERLMRFAEERPMALYPWLRQQAWQQVITQHRRHLGADLRSVRREWAGWLPDHSSANLADQLVANDTSPSRQAQRRETCETVRAAIGRLMVIDREVLTLRYLEQLTTQETAEVLGLTKRGVKTRQRRALERISELLNDQL
jgi:RNA polymerase sigma-70 factor (ECF subfamily)